MNERNPYAELGLIVAIGVFICLLIKSLLFGFTWASIVGVALSVIYFVLSWLYDSHSPLIKHTTTAFLLLSVLVAVTLTLFDKNARPKMHAFEGTVGDTIQDRKYEEKNPTVTMYETLPEVIDTTTREEIDTTITDDIIEEGVSIDEDGYITSDTIPTLAD